MGAASQTSAGERVRSTDGAGTREKASAVASFLRRGTCVCAHTLLFGLIGTSINRIMTPGEPAFDPLELLI